jgi:hypothetical protein
MIRITQHMPNIPNAKTKHAALGSWIARVLDDSQILKAHDETRQAIEKGDWPTAQDKLEAVVDLVKKRHRGEDVEFENALKDLRTAVTPDPAEKTKAATVRHRPESGLPFQKTGKPPGSLGA